MITKAKKSSETSVKNSKKFAPEVATSGQNILIIVESPNKIKTIVSYLPKDNRYRVLPSVGHIADLAKTGAYNLGLDLNDKYKPSFVLSTDRTEVIRAILEAAKLADKILIATDPDREGEHIGFSVVEKVRCFGKPIKRIEIHKITKQGIADALAMERDIDEDLVESAVARRVLDRVVGFLASPLIIKRLGKGLSAGRVQSVALRMVVEKEREIEAFKPEEYWNIQASLVKFADDIVFAAKYHSDKTVSNEKDATAIKKELEESSFTVAKIDAKEAKKNPPTPITTSKLHQLSSARFGFSGQRTMKAAQRLYESGRITYIRTDSIRQAAEAVQEIRKWLGSNKPASLPSSPILYKNKSGSAQDAHEAIRPTDISDIPIRSCVTDEDKLYKLIWEVTVASQMTPAIYDTTTVSIKTNKKRELRATGSVLRDPGWLTVTQYADLEKEEEKDSKLPAMVVGDVLNLVPPRVTAEQKFTKPPKRYTEGSLVKELEKKGIGRPSTYADITNKITSREYISKTGNSFVATETGKKIVDFLIKYFDFMQYDYTSGMEEKLDKIAKGEFSYEAMMEEFYPLFKRTVDKAYDETMVDSGTDVKCPKCGRRMEKKKGAFGEFLGCSGYPECKGIMNFEMVNGEMKVKERGVEGLVSDAPEDMLCPDCGGKMLQKVGRFGKFYSCAKYPKCKGTKALWSRS